MADLIDPFDESTEGDYDMPVMLDNGGLVDPYDEAIVVVEPEPVDVPRETPKPAMRPMSEIVDERTPWQSFQNVFTGADRRTRATEQFPELLGETSGLLADMPKGQVAKMVPALMTTMDPEEQADIIQANAPQITRQYDPAGNIVLYNENLDTSAVVNKPGWTMQDTLQSLGLIAEFWPTTRAAAGAKSIPGAMMRTGAATGGVESINQALQAAAGGRFDVGEVGLVAGGGAAMEGLGILLAKQFLPMWRRMRGTVSPEMRASFRDAAEQAGIDPEAMTDDFIKSWMDDADRAVQGAPEGEFGIRYTKGQRTGEERQIAREERLRKGPTRASERMEAFRQEQAGDIMAARQRQLERMGPEPVATPLEAAERVTEGVGRRAELARRGIEQAYEDVGPASLRREGQKGLVTRLQRRARADDFDVNAETSPMTARTMGELREMQQFVEDVGNKLPDQSLKHVERWRRRLNNRIDGAKDKIDRRQMVVLKREFDDYLRRAVDRSLFRGDQEALTNLREASDLYAAYRQTFTRQDTRLTSGKIKDKAGELIERMVEYDDLMPEEVVNFLFGVSGLGRKPDAARAVKKIRNVVGSESPEFQALRQAAFLKITDPGKDEVFSGAKMLTALTDARKHNQSLLDALFSKPEQATMFRFANAVKKAQPDPRNPSGTSHMAAGYIADTWNKLMRMIGFAQGGITGAMAAEGAAQTSKQIGNIRAGMQAKAATSRPIERIRASGLFAVTEPGRELTAETLETAVEGGQSFLDNIGDLKAAP